MSFGHMSSSNSVSLNLFIIIMFVVFDLRLLLLIFLSLFNPCPAEPGFTLPLQTV